MNSRMNNPAIYCIGKIVNFPIGSIAKECTNINHFCKISSYLEVTEIRRFSDE